LPSVRSKVIGNKNRNKTPPDFRSLSQWFDFSFLTRLIDEVACGYRVDDLVFFLRR